MANGIRRAVAELRYEVEQQRDHVRSYGAEGLVQEELLELAEELLSHVDEMMACRPARTVVVVPPGSPTHAAEGSASCAQCKLIIHKVGCRRCGVGQYVVCITKGYKRAAHCHAIRYKDYKAA